MEANDNPDQGINLEAKCEGNVDVKEVSKIYFLQAIKLQELLSQLNFLKKCLHTHTDRQTDRNVN